MVIAAAESSDDEEDVDDAPADRPDAPRAGGKPFMGECDAVGGGHAPILGATAQSPLCGS